MRAPIEGEAYRRMLSGCLRAGFDTVYPRKATDRYAASGRRPGLIAPARSIASPAAPQPPAPPPTRARHPRPDDRSRPARLVTRRPRFRLCSGQGAHAAQRTRAPLLPRTSRAAAPGHQKHAPAARRSSFPWGLRRHALRLAPSRSFSIRGAFPSASRAVAIAPAGGASRRLPRGRRSACQQQLHPPTPRRARARASYLLLS